jgi:hypothetical protein
VQIFRGSTKKQRSLDSKDSSLNREGNDVKGPHANKESRGKQPGRKPGPNQAKMSLGRPTWADRPSPFRARFDAPFDLAAIRTIYSPLAKSHKEIDSSSAATRPRTRSRLDREGSTRGLHLFQGILHHDQCYNE